MSWESFERLLRLYTGSGHLNTFCRIWCECNIRPFPACALPCEKTKSKGFKFALSSLTTILRLDIGSMILILPAQDQQCIKNTRIQEAVCDLLRRTFQELKWEVLFSKMNGGVECSHLVKQSL